MKIKIKKKKCKERERTINYKKLNKIEIHKKRKNYVSEKGAVEKRSEVVQS